MLKSLCRSVILLCLEFILAVLLICLTAILPKRRTKLIWGTIPIINNKYWSVAMARAGWDSVTLMEGFYETINKREDFDIILQTLVPSWVKSHVLREAISLCLGFLYIVRHARVLHIPASGGPLARFTFWFLEAHLLRLAGIKTVVIPYGRDVWMYSKILDGSVKHGLLSCYPDAGYKESEITRRVRYWEHHGDVVISGFLIDGRGRWDVTVHNILCLDLDLWKGKETYSSADGLFGTVKVVHTPNHRDYKGSEFLIAAVEALKQEGLNIELVLIEKLQNNRVRELMWDADILADQFINSGYGLAAVEGMASGLPVLCNLELEARTLIFRRYAFLDECPIVSAPPERLTATLRLLVTRPDLREVLGRSGRQYVEKYHSYEATQYLFSAIYDKILFGKNVDLMNLFHPLKSDFNKRRSVVTHPLVNNRFPDDISLQPGRAQSSQLMDSRRD